MVDNDFAAIRGPVTYAAWREATPGTPVRRNESGWTGTVVRVAARHMTVRWDKSGAVGRVAAPAYDLTPIDLGECQAHLYGAVYCKRPATRLDTVIEGGRDGRYCEEHAAGYDR